jgi:hypothetical protein
MPHTYLTRVVLNQGFLWIYKEKPTSSNVEKPRVVPLLNVSLKVKEPGDESELNRSFYLQAYSSGSPYNRYYKGEKEGEQFEWAYAILCNSQGMYYHH